MLWIKRNIPNFFTLLNLACGLSVIFGSAQLIFSGTGVYSELPLIFSFFELGQENSNFKGYLFFIFLGTIFDFLDGLAARLLKVESRIGKHLDSLADMVTFGIAPAIILIYIFHALKPDSFWEILAGISIIFIPICSAIRLARFNIDDGPRNYFIGLPTPAVALFIMGLGYFLSSGDFVMKEDLGNLFVVKHQQTISAVLISMSAILPILLVSNIRLFSFKISKKENAVSTTNIFRSILVIGGMLLFLKFSFGAFAFIIPLYLILSVTNNILE